MKKLALVLAVLLVVGGAAFAEVTAGEPTVTGSVSTTIGMDLESEVWGMDENDSITLTIPLAAGSDGASGDDDLYGEVTITDIAVNVIDTAFDDDDNSEGTISGKIVAGDMYVGLNWGGYNNNYAEGGSDYDVNLDGDWFDVPAYGDLAFGYDNGTIGVEFEVAAKSGITRASDETYTTAFADAWTGDADTTTVDDEADAGTQVTTGLVFSLDVEYANDTVAFPVYATLDPEYAADTMLVGVSADPSVAAGDLSIAVPVDFVMIGEEMGIDTAPTVSYDVTDAVTVSADAYYYNHFDALSFLDAGVCVATDGLVAGLTASVDVDLTDVTSSDADAELGWGVDVALAYVAADGLTISVEPGYDSDEDLDFAASVEFGSAFTGIDNTCISIDYTDAVLAGDTDKGIVSCTATVSF